MGIGRDIRSYHRGSTTTSPKLPSEFFAFLFVRIVLCQYYIEDLRRHRRNSPPSSLLSFLCVSSKTHEKTEDRPPIFRTDLFSCSLMSSMNYTRTDRRFSGPTFFSAGSC